MNVLIADDEPLARELMEDNVRKVSYLNLVGSCGTGLAALDAIQKKPVDLILLDIQMPGLTGVRLLQTVKKPIIAIFITAYEEYALEGYALGVVDYLLKPVPFDRFLKAVDKAHEVFKLRENAQTEKSQDFIFVQADYHLVKVDLLDVNRIEGMKDYVKIHLQSSSRPIITRISVKHIEGLLPKEKFVRVHRSYIVAIQKIISIRKGRIRMGDIEIPLGDSYAKNLFRIIQTA